MKGKGSLFLKKKLQSVIFKLVVEDTALNAYHNHKRMTKYLVGAKKKFSYLLR